MFLTFQTYTLLAHAVAHPSLDLPCMTVPETIHSSSTQGLLGEGRKERWGWKLSSSRTPSRGSGWEFQDISQIKND